MVSLISQAGLGSSGESWLSWFWQFWQRSCPLVSRKTEEQIEIGQVIFLPKHRVQNSGFLLGDAVANNFPVHCGILLVCSGLSDSYTAVFPLKSFSLLGIP